MISTTEQRQTRLIRCLFTAAVCAAALSSTVAIAQDKGAPPWGEFLRQGRFPGFDRLLRRPFRMAPEEEVKGLAAKLRARELDIPNRQRAIKYLKTFHCAQFPEARAMLVDVLLNDRWEPVRYEAAKGLRDMFLNCACANGNCGNGENGSSCQTCNSCNCNYCQTAAQQGKDEEDEDDKKKKSKRQLRQDRTRGAPDADSPAHCTCCCDAETLNKLAKVAYELKENGCCFEPSRRVREMAVEAIKACGLPCDCQPYKAEEYGPPAFDAINGDQQQDDDGGGREFVPPPTRELDFQPTQNVPLLKVPFTKAEPISRLKDVCLVSLREGHNAQANPSLSVNYRGRLYHFASPEAQARFEANPEEYAVAFGGCDPVHFVRNREAVEGRYLVEHEGRLYMFATKQNYEIFKLDATRYGGRQASQSHVALVSKETEE